MNSVQAGYREARPPTCPTSVHTLLIKCWASTPADRPSFADLVRTHMPDTHVMPREGRGELTYSPRNACDFLLCRISPHSVPFVG